MRREYDQRQVTGRHIALYLQEESQQWSSRAAVKLTEWGVVIGFKPWLEEEEDGQPIPLGYGRLYAVIGGRYENGIQLTRRTTVFQRVVGYAEGILARSRDLDRRAARIAPAGDDEDDGGLRAELERDPFAEEE